MTKPAQARKKAGASVPAAMPDEDSVTTNLQGQRLGRKGRDTRDRILEATRVLIDGDPDRPPSLSAVAREASLRMSSIYVYFKDLTELMLAVLEPVSAQSEEAYVHLIREWWPDDELPERTLRFVHAFYSYWQKHSNILHLRNQMSDQHDKRMMIHRVQMARPVIDLLSRQMNEEGVRRVGVEYDMSSVLFTGLERVVTSATDEKMHAVLPTSIQPRMTDQTLFQEARLLAMAIADERRRTAEERATRTS